MILLVALAVSAVGWLSYRNLEQALLPRVLDRIETHSRLVAAELESHVRGVPGDITSFRACAAVERPDARASGGRHRSDRWRPAATGASGWQVACRAYWQPSRPIQLRLSGSRTISAKSSASTAPGPNGAMRIVPEPELRRIGDAPKYFDKTIKLPPSKIFVSPDRPGRGKRGRRDAECADMQVATPVFAPDGKPFGNCHHQCRHAAGARSHPVIGAAGWRDVRRRRTRAAISFTPIPRANSARNRACRPTGRTTSPAWRRRSEQGRAVAHILPDQTGRPGGIALAPAALAGERMGRRHRNRSQRGLHGAGSSHPGHIPAGRADRRAVRGRAGRAHRADADQADHSIDCGRRGGRTRRSSRHSGRCGRRDRRTRARIRPGDG